MLTLPSSIHRRASSDSLLMLQPCLSAAQKSRSLGTGADNVRRPQQRLRAAARTTRLRPCGPLQSAKRSPSSPSGLFRLQQFPRTRANRFFLPHFNQTWKCWKVKENPSRRFPLATRGRRDRHDERKFSSGSDAPAKPLSIRRHNCVTGEPSLAGHKSRYHGATSRDASSRHVPLRRRRGDCRCAYRSGSLTRRSGHTEMAGRAPQSTRATSIVSGFGSSRRALLISRAEQGAPSNCVSTGEVCTLQLANADFFYPEEGGAALQKTAIFALYRHDCKVCRENCHVFELAPTCQAVSVRIAAKAKAKATRTREPEPTSRTLARVRACALSHTSQTLGRFLATTRANIPTSPR
jgi:hypothetical protein